MPSKAQTNQYLTKLAQLLNLSYFQFIYLGTKEIRIYFYF